MKVIGVNFFETQCIYLKMALASARDSETVWRTAAKFCTQTCFVPVVQDKGSVWLWRR